MKNLSQLVQKIHSDPLFDVKIVVAMSGSGMTGISELMRHGRGSNTLLAQHMLYSESATEEYVGKLYGKFVSEETARQLAMAAYEEAKWITEKDPRPVIGVGCTSSLVKPDGERDGRKHSVFIAIQSALWTSVWRAELDQSRTREEEEDILGRMLIKVISQERGISWNDPEVTELVTSVSCKYGQTHHVAAFLDTNIPWVFGDQIPAVDLTKPFCLLSGSFNPLHQAHLKMAQIAVQKTSLPVVFEMSVMNTDKPKIDYIEIAKREQQFIDLCLPLLITDVSRFVEKAPHMPFGSCFVMGMDTFERLIDQEYYKFSFFSLQEMMDWYQGLGLSFLVFHRDGDDSTMTEETAPIEVLPITQFVNSHEFFERMSSTELRARMC